MRVEILRRRLHVSRLIELVNMSSDKVESKKYEFVAPDGGWGYMIFLSFIINIVSEPRNYINSGAPQTADRTRSVLFYDCNAFEPQTVGLVRRHNFFF